MGVQGVKMFMLRVIIIPFLLPLITSIWMETATPVLFSTQSSKHTSKVLISSSNVLLPSLTALPNQSRSRLRFFTTTVSSLELPPQTSANIFGYCSHYIGRRGEVYVLTGARHSLTSSLIGRSHLGMVKCRGETCY